MKNCGISEKNSCMQIFGKHLVKQNRQEFSFCRIIKRKKKKKEVNDKFLSGYYFMYLSEIYIFFLFFKLIQILVRLKVICLVFAEKAKL